MSYLALSASFEYLCYESTANINNLILSVRGSSLYVRNLTSTDVRFRRIKTVPALKGLGKQLLLLDFALKSNHLYCAAVLEN